MYDLALYPAPGPGFGHLMRCLALAQWAVELKAKVIVVLKEPSPVSWPCPVLVGAGAAVTAKLGIVDHAGEELGGNTWAIIDKPERPGNADGLIYPHFGAEAVPGWPTFVGPSWMPLRTEFSVPRPDRQRSRVLGYRAEMPGVEELVGLGAWRMVGMLDQALKLIAPASTITYEALSRGTSVELLHVPFPGCEEIGAAMVAAGVATWYGSGDRLAIPSGVDGLGAKRLLEALL